MTTHVIQGLFNGLRSYFAVDNSYARPRYYWSTLPQCGILYDENVNMLGKVCGKKLRAQVTDIKLVPRDEAKMGYPESD